MKKLTCPYCDSDHVEPMPPSPFAVESGDTWYQCDHCVRMWGVSKVPLRSQGRSERLPNLADPHSRRG